MAAKEARKLESELQLQVDNMDLEHSRLSSRLGDLIAQLYTLSKEHDESILASKELSTKEKKLFTEESESMNQSQEKEQRVNELQVDISKIMQEEVEQNQEIIMIIKQNCAQIMRIRKEFDAVNFQDFVAKED